MSDTRNSAKDVPSGPALDVLLKVRQIAGYLIHVVDLDAEVIQAVWTLVRRVGQNRQLEVAVGQVKGFRSSPSTGGQPSLTSRKPKASI